MSRNESFINKLNPNSQIPNPKQIPITQCSNNHINQTHLFLNFGHCNFGHYLDICAWNLVIPHYP
jgi:hypothetical protein